MPICFQCIHCGARVSVHYLKPGERAQCKACGQFQIVPPESLPEAPSDNRAAQAPPTPFVLDESEFYRLLSGGPPSLPPPPFVFDQTEFYRLVASRPLALPPPPVVPAVPFKRAFGITAALIIALQAFGVILLAKHGFHFDEVDIQRHITSDIGALVWYAIVLVVVLTDMPRFNVPVDKTLRFSWSALKIKPDLLGKCVGGVTLILVLMNALIPVRSIGIADLPLVTKLLSFVVVVIAAPICEEILFRGYLYNSMRSIIPRERERQIVNAVLFAAAHVFLPAFLLGATVPYYIFALGFVLAYLYERTGSVVPPIALHMFNNGLVFFIELLSANGTLSTGGN